MSTIAASQRTRHGSLLATHARTVLAASGFVMIGFVIVHMAGNLLAFAGSASFNGYARSIREVGSPLVGEGTLLAIARVRGTATIAAFWGHL